MSSHEMKIPDSKERDAALDPKRSFIVEAPAGSGKTELLIRRYLRLLSTVDKPEDILALTFTRKAAAEMHSRVMEALLFASKDVAPDEPYRLETYVLSREALVRDKEKRWGLLENPSRLRVQTIDSLSARIVARMPVLSTLGGRPKLVEEPEEIYEEAARRTIEKVEEDSRDGQCVREALSHLDNFMPNLSRRLVQMLKKRDQWLRIIGVGPMESEDSLLRESLEAPIRAIVEDALQRLPPLFDSSILAQFLKSARYGASTLINEGKQGSITRLADLEELPGTRAENIDRWRDIGTFLMTDKGEWRKPTGVNKTIGFPSDKDKESVGEKNDFKALLDELSGRDELRQALGALKILPTVRYDEDEWSILVALLHLLPVAAAELSAVFASEGLLDFQSLTMAASNSLGTEDDPEKLLLAIDASLKHLLVDEFQDTSKSHFELIEKLVSGFVPGDGRTLFIVGDPMQSIYLFRDADVGLFLKAAEERVANLELERLKLTSNFRSLPAIVEWVNATFAPAFPEFEDISSGAVTFTNSHAAVEDARSALINMNIYASRDDELEAIDIVESIETIRENNSPHETVAILVRSRAHLALIVEELKARKIDFRTTKLDPLIECSVVQDLMSLTRALMHPFDRVAWLALLRAPFCGLPLSEIHKLFSGDRKSAPFELMTDPERTQSLTDESKARLLRFTDKMLLAQRKNGRVGERALLESIWVELGGPATLKGSGEMENAELFFSLVDKFSQTGVPFSVDALTSRVRKLFATHNGESDNPIEIMTIHNAKGLEFDHVFLPGLGKQPRGEKKELLTWIEKDGDTLLAPVEGMEFRENRSLYSYICLLKAEKLRFEQARLFYVAATRAKKSLSLYGHAKSIKEAKEGESKRLAVDSRSLLSIIEGSLDISTFKPLEDNSRDLSEQAKGTTPPTIKLRRLDSLWKAPEPAAALKRDKVTRMPDIIDEGKDRPSFDWATEERKHIGTVLHRYFCRIVRDGLEGWDAEKARGEFSRMSAMLRGLGLSEEKAKASAEDSVLMLIKALSDEHGRFLLSSHNEDDAEFQLTGIAGGVIKDVKIDRTFVDSDNVRWIVDYKTSKHSGGDEDAFIENEKIRYAPQLRKYKELWVALDASREIKCALYFPEFSRLEEL